MVFNWCIQWFSLSSLSLRAVSDLGLVGISSRTCMVRSVCECPGWLKCLPTLVLPCVRYESGAAFQFEACSMSLRCF